MADEWFSVFLSSACPPPTPLAELPDAMRARCLRDTPRLPRAPLRWLASCVVDSPWRCALSAHGTTPDPLIDDAMCGPGGATAAQLQRATAEMAKALSGIFAVPTGGGWIFVNSTLAPLLWCTMALVADRGDTARVQCAIAAGLPRENLVMARLLLERTRALLVRAGDAAVPDGFRATTLLYADASQIVDLRPAAAKALASALMAAAIWSDEAMRVAPLPLLSALTLLPRSGLAVPYGASAPDVCRVLDLQAQCTLGPPGGVNLPNRVHDVEAATVLAMLVGWYLHLSGAMSFEAAVVARMLIWSERACVHFVDKLMPAAWAPAAWCASAYYDMCSSVWTTQHDRYCLPPFLMPAIMRRLALLRAHFGAAVPIELLLTCSPLGMRAPAAQALAMPPTTPAEVWRRVVPIQMARACPEVLAIAGSEAALRETHAEHLLLVDLLQSSCARRVARALLYHPGAQNTEEFAGFLAAVRMMALQYGDREWVRPGNFVIGDGAVLVAADAARVLMLRALMLQLYARPACVLYMPFAAPVVARELCTLCEIADADIRREAAGAVCDLVAAMMCHAPPAHGAAHGGAAMTYATMRIRAADADQPWPVTVCTVFLPRFLGPVTHAFFEHSLRVNSKPLYSGYLSTVLAMLRAPDDPDVGFWLWPRRVRDALLRYFFLMHMRMQGKLDDDSVPVPRVLELNPRLVQALAYLYVYQKLPSSEAGAEYDDAAQQRAGARGRAAPAHDLAEMTLEERTLQLFPPASSMRDDIAHRTREFAQLATIPLSYAPGEYGALVSRPADSLGSRDSLRNGQRAALLPILSDAAIHSFAHALDRASAESDDADADAADGAPAPPKSATTVACRRMKRGQRPAELLAVAATSAVPARPAPPMASRFDAGDEPGRRTARRTDAAQASPHAYGGDDYGDDAAAEPDAKRVANALRRVRYEQVRRAGQRLSRFVVLAITMAASDPAAASGLPVSFVRGALGTLSVSCGAGNRGTSWELSTKGAQNDAAAIERTMHAVWAQRAVAPLPQMYSVSPASSPAFTSLAQSGYTSGALESLLDIEIAPFVSRAALARDPRYGLLHNSMPALNGLEQTRSWDLPVASQVGRGPAGEVPLIHPYSLDIGVAQGFAHGAPAPGAHVPYDFSAALWMWRVRPFANTTELPYDGVGVELSYRYADALAGVLDRDVT